MSQSNLRIVILITGLFTAIVHLVVLNIGIVAEYGRPDPLFTLNGLGYLVLLAAYFWKTPALKQRHGFVSWAFIAFTAVTILAWVAVGAREGILPYLTKLSEVILLAALWINLREEKAAPAR